LERETAVAEGADARIESRERKDRAEDELRLHRQGETLDFFQGPSAETQRHAQEELKGCFVKFHEERCRRGQHLHAANDVDHDLTRKENPRGQLRVDASVRRDHARKPDEGAKKGEEKKPLIELAEVPVARNEIVTTT